ncbi:MAG: hypothetical protein JW940_01455 [Polyangiaceae bacterium]|nr:hypothetical protein [Polyangiaceae bacterium]
MWHEHAAVLAEFIGNSDRHIVAELDGAGVIVDSSVGFSRLLGRNDKPVGTPFYELFADERSDRRSGLPQVGYLVARARPPSIPSRLEAQAIRSGEKLLVVAEQVHVEQNVVEQLARLNDEMTNLTRQLHKDKAELERSIARIKRLEGLIAICSYCHRIRNETQSWQRLEEYLTDHSDALFSHGLCPECEAKYFGDLVEE